MIRLDIDRATLARFVDEVVGQAQVAVPPGKPDLAGFDAVEIDIARVSWANRIVDEYRSVIVFSDLLHCMAVLEQPFAALCTVQRLIGDELRHTWMCAEVASWLGGMSDLAIDLDGLGIAAGEPSGARILEIVGRELVVAETESVCVLQAYRNATTEPLIKAVMDSLLCDEVRHAAAGRELYALLEKSLPTASTAALRERLPAVMDDDRKRLRTAYAASAVGGPGRGLGASLRPSDLTWSC